MADNQAKAAAAKELGNAAFAQKNYADAIKHFTEGIALDPTNHVLYSNRSACHASSTPPNWQAALEDAKKVVELNAQWGKGYSRLGAALHGMGKLPEALDAYSAGLKVDPGNAMLEQGAREVQAEMSRQGTSRLGQLFQGDVLAMVRANPKLAPYADQPDFVAKVEEMKRNPQSLAQHLADPRVTELLSAMLGVDINAAAAGAGAGAGSRPAHQAPPQESTPPPKPQAKKEPPPPADPTEGMTPEQKEAFELKEAGNALYKQKKFAEAEEKYTAAVAKDETNLVYHNNLAACHFEMGRFEDCVADCQRAIDIGREHFADFTLMAKAKARLGNAYMKLDRYAEAVRAYEDSLADNRTAPVLKALQEAEKKKKLKDDADYVNPEIAMEEKNKGNEYFKADKVPEAIKHYTEAMRRNPSDHILYSNRAACYLKLGEYGLALRDCDKCIEMSPDFAKAYTRKGHALYFMKDYNKALAAYDEGLKRDPKNEELAQSIQRTIQAVQRMQQGGDKEATARAMEDPEIQHILMDPAMRTVLDEMKSNPAAAQAYMSDPVVMAKLTKLINAGIIRVG